LLPSLGTILKVEVIFAFIQEALQRSREMKEICPVGGDEAEPVNDSPLVLGVHEANTTPCWSR